MPASEYSSTDLPTLICLHFLGGSATEWEAVSRRLAGSHRCVTIDLAGFGDEAESVGYSVAEMADRVAGIVRDVAPGCWTLVGHSMGAKIAAVLARRAEDGEAGLAGLERLVLLAGSPPGPEPMEDSQRRTMMGWFAGNAESSRAEAQGYIDQNIGGKLDPAGNGRAVGDVLRTNRSAWLAWLESGSREDWSARVGILRTPTLLVAGTEDAALGADAQRSLAMPHYTDVRLVVLSGAGHLLPLERPDAVADLILGRGPDIGEAYRELIASDRVSHATREALLARTRPDPVSYQPGAMDAAQLTTLRAVVDRVLPQPDTARIDLAARIDTLLASGEGDGWRFARLPPDAEAFRAALRSLERAASARHGRGFAQLDDGARDAMLHGIADGRADAEETGPDLLDSAQMQLWFEDLRAEAVRIYVAHPATLARMGYSGIAYGGDGERKSGFVRVGTGERESWEPMSETGRTPS